MKAFYCDHFELPLPPNHRFPMAKYRLLRERILAEKLLDDDQLTVPDGANDAQILLAHNQDYLDRIKSGSLSRAEVRALGFPWSPQLVERSRRSSGATIAAAEYALHNGTGVNLAGGTHHAGKDYPQGYCVFNDTAIAARHMQQTCTNLERVLICDLDVHQGNGTANILHGDSTIFTFSMHGEKNFPLRKAVSDWDIALKDGTNDETYLALLEDALPNLWQKVEPQMIFFIAGADPFEQDRLGRLGLTKQGLAARDTLVMEFARTHKVPLVVVMAGGYAKDVSDVVDLHFQTVQLARDLGPVKSEL